MAKRAMDTYFTYQFLRRLTTPFDKMKAYEHGIINDRGETIKDVSDLTPAEKNDFTYFDRLVINIKRLIQQVPGMSDNRLSSVAAAMFLLREEITNYEPEDILEFASALEQTPLNESPTVSIGAGSVDNTTVAIGPGQQPQFGKCKTYDCDSNTFQGVRRQKNPHERFDKFVSDKKLLTDVREYAKRYPGNTIVLRDSHTGAYTILKFGKNGWG